MADEQKARLEKLIRLHEAEADLIAKLTTIRQEVETLLNGGAGIGTQIRTAIGHWNSEWHGGSGYEFTAGDTKNLKRFLLGHGLEAVTARMTRYLRSDEPFYRRVNHAFPVFVKDFNQFAPRVESTVLAEDVVLTQERLRQVRG